MRLTTSQNALHFGMKCSKLRRFLGLRPIPRWGSLRRSLRPPSPAVLNLWAADLCSVGRDQGWELRNLFDVSHVSESMIRY